MFSGTSTPVAASKRPHTRASAAVRRSQSRAGSLAPSTPVAAGAEGAATSTRSRKLGLGAGTTARSGLSGRAINASYAGSEAGVGAETEDVDVDGLESQGILLRTESHAVRVLGVGLPVEVQQVLERSDAYTDPYAAILDHNAGYACLTGRDRCYVWSLAQTSSTSSPTCYVFPVLSSPSSSLSLAASIFSPVPFVAFVPQGGAGREPGFLLVAPTGSIAYWSSISQALSGVDRCSTSSIQLTQGEVVRALHKLSTTHYVLATSGARLFSLHLSSSLSSSSVDIQISLLSRSRGVLARVGGLFGGASADPRAGILALTFAKEESTSSSRGGRGDGASILYAVQDRAVQSWRITESTEQFLGELDVYDLLRDAIYDAFDTLVTPSSQLQPEIVDVAALSHDKILLLVSFPSICQQQKSSRANRTEYAFITLSAGFKVESTKLLSYSHEPNPTPLSSPKLYLPPGHSSLAFVVFPEIVCLVSLRDFHLEEEIGLRNPIKDRLIGAGCQSSTVLTLLAASSGLLQLEVNQSYLDTEKQKAASRSLDLEDSEAAATRRLKNKLDQAVIFGDRAKNPLAFELRIDSTGDLVQATEAVSKEILSSSSPHLPNIIDLRAQLADRAARLRFLITFIQDNSLINRLSKTSKRHLSWDAEKLNAAMGLWSLQNARMALGQDSEESVLSNAIEAVNVGSKFGEDSTRTFFRFSIDKLGAALEGLLPILQTQSMTQAPLASRTSTIYQIAQSLSVVYKTTLRFRSESSNIYDIPNSDQTCLSEPWSSRSTMLELLRTVIESTERLLQDRTRELGSNIDNEEMIEYATTARGNKEREERETQRDLKEFMAELADYALAMHQERMAYLQSLGDEGSAVAELRNLLEVYVKLRAHVISSLAHLSRTNVAYDLAERYRDHKSLVLLCNDPQIGSPVRVQFYIEKYKEDFGFALYQYYLENGRLHDLMTQDRVYEDMLSKFLKNSNVPRLSWIQDVSTQRYEDASVALLQEAARETQLAEQKLMLSIGKLAKIATLTRSQLESSEPAQRALEAIDDRMDFVASHDRIIEICRNNMDARDFRKPLDVQASNCVTRLCGNQKEAMQHLAASLFEGLLSGRALSPEDLVDLLSLKNNDSEDQIADYANAIELLTRDRQRTPQARTQLALKGIWRRVYLREDWTALRQFAKKNSDEALAEILRGTALFTTLLSGATKSLDPSLLLRPSETIFSNTEEEEDAVRARFSSSSIYDKVPIDSVVNEYVEESLKLKGMVDNDMVRLEEFYDEVERLVGLEMEGQNQQPGQQMMGDETLMMDESMG